MKLRFCDWCVKKGFIGLKKVAGRKERKNSFYFKYSEKVTFWGTGNWGGGVGEFCCSDRVQVFFPFPDPFFLLSSSSVSCNTMSPSYTFSFIKTAVAHQPDGQGKQGYEPSSA